MIGVVQLVVVALEGIACALNPKLRKESRKITVAFGLFYIGFFVVGIVVLIMVVRSLYFRK